MQYAKHAINRLKRIFGLSALNLASVLGHLATLARSLQFLMSVAQTYTHIHTYTETYINLCDTAHLLFSNGEIHNKNKRKLLL